MLDDNLAAKKLQIRDVDEASNGDGEADWNAEVVNISIHRLKYVHIRTCHANRLSLTLLIRTSIQHNCNLIVMI